MEHSVIAYLVPGAEADWDVFDLEDRLSEAIEATGVGEFDGNLMGPGEVELYAYGPRPTPSSRSWSRSSAHSRSRRARTRSSATGPRTTREHERSASS
jgi:hypothetical protein